MRALAAIFGDALICAFHLVSLDGTRQMLSRVRGRANLWSGRKLRTQPEKGCAPDVRERARAPAAYAACEARRAFPDAASDCRLHIHAPARTLLDIIFALNQRDRAVVEGQ